MKHKISLLLLAATLAISACVAPAKITYVKDMEIGEEYPAKPAPELRVQPTDRLTIEVFSEAESLAKPFTTGALTQAGVGITSPAKYIVDAEGYIDFPVLGRIHVEGLTMKGVQEKIAGIITEAGYIRQPIIRVNLDNFTVTVVKYGTTTQMAITGRSVNLLQVVAPNNGEKIKEVEVIRMENGVRKAYHVNFLTKELFDSPVFYLQQNDIVYVKPSRWLMSQTWQTLRTAVASVLGFANTTLSILVLLRIRNR